MPFAVIEGKGRICSLLSTMILPFLNFQLIGVLEMARLGLSGRGSSVEGARLRGGKFFRAIPLYVEQVWV